MTPREHIIDCAAFFQGAVAMYCFLKGNYWWMFLLIPIALARVTICGWITGRKEE